MSTKKIENALDILHAHGEFDGSDSAKAAAIEARAELESIRKAAKAWAESDHGELPEDLGDLMESIAKEKP